VGDGSGARQRAKQRPGPMPWYGRLIKGLSTDTELFLRRFHRLFPHGTKPSRNLPAALTVSLDKRVSGQ
jgi:hypothetical protein